MRQIYKDRLVKLRDFIKTVPEKRFDITSWVTGDFCGKAQEPTHAHCGTAACVGGWACTIPEFKKAGLKLVVNGDDPMEPAYKELSSIEALSRFFGLDNVEVPYQIASELSYPVESMASYIFHGSNRGTVKDAVKRIDNVLKIIEAQETLDALKP